jgi:ribonuclease HIII
MLSNVNDEKLKEFYDSIESILLANNFTIESWRSISYGLQFRISRDDSDGLLRIYTNKKGTFMIDYSQLKDPELLANVRQLLEEKPVVPRILPEPSVPPGKKSDDRYDLGYPIIGTDESGKGDYFGPLVCAAVYVDETTAGELRSIGVRDSKTCTKTEIAEIAEKISILCAGKFEIIEFSPERYNRLYEQLSSEGKNLNTLLAWGHAKAIEELLKKVDCDLVLADKFGDESLIRGKLQERGKTVRLVQMHRAEQNIAVAAASILARARFLERIAAISGKYAMSFPLGASAGVIVAGKQFVAKHGLPKLHLVAKMHFKTTSDVMGRRDEGS